MRTNQWSVVLALSVAILAPLATMAFEDAPPVRLTSHEDHQRLMDLLHMTSIRRGRDGNNKDSPYYANYDESKANPYPNLPDPLVLKNGKKVTKASDWWNKRRPEIVEDFDREIYGRVPKVTPSVKWEVTGTTSGMNGDVPILTKQLVGTVDNSSYPYIEVKIALTLTTPAQARGPVPVVMQFGGGFGFGALGASRGAVAGQAPAGPPYGPDAFRAARAGGRAPALPLPGRGAPAAAMPGSAASGAVAATAPAATGIGAAGTVAATGTAAAGSAPSASPAAGAAPTPGTVLPAFGRGGFPGGGRGPAGPTWQQQVLARGWGYASLNPGSIQADDGAGMTLGIIGLVNKGQPRKLDDWGVLRAWAWGVSRALDYFETDKAVDARHVALEGHSRWGKAALVAMAYDQRFWTAYVSSSGEGGAKLHRRNWGEVVENVAGRGRILLDGRQLPQVRRAAQLERPAGGLPRTGRPVRAAPGVHQRRRHQRRWLGGRQGHVPGGGRGRTGVPAPRQERHGDDRIPAHRDSAGRRGSGLPAT